MNEQVFPKYNVSCSQIQPSLPNIRNDILFVSLHIRTPFRINKKVQEIPRIIKIYQFVAMRGGRARSLIGTCIETETYTDTYSSLSVRLKLVNGQKYLYRANRAKAATEKKTKCYNYATECFSSDILVLDHFYVLFTMVSFTRYYSLMIVNTWVIRVQQIRKTAHTAV